MDVPTRPLFAEEVAAARAARAKELEPEVVALVDEVCRSFNARLVDTGVQPTTQNPVTIWMRDTPRTVVRHPLFAPTLEKAFAASGWHAEIDSYGESVRVLAPLDTSVPPTRQRCLCCCH